MIFFQIFKSSSHVTSADIKAIYLPLVLCALFLFYGLLQRTEVYALALFLFVLINCVTFI